MEGWCYKICTAGMADLPERKQVQRPLAVPGGRCQHSRGWIVWQSRRRWGRPRHVVATVETFKELGKLLSPMGKEAFQYFNNHRISLDFVLRWFSVFIIVLSCGLHFKAENCVSHSDFSLSTQWREPVFQRVWVKWVPATWITMDASSANSQKSISWMTKNFSIIHSWTS